MTRQRVLQLVGSPTSAFHQELSELYARGCIEALQPAGVHEFFIAHVSPDGKWRFPASLAAEALDVAEPCSFAQAVSIITGQAIDIALPQMFCQPGMTHYRALLDLLHIPYLGNPPLQMALTADKAKSRSIVAAAGVDVPHGELLRPGQTPSLVPPVVVKPNSADNSDGVTLVLSMDDYDDALAVAFLHADTVIVEEYIKLGREVRCGIVERRGELECLPLEEYNMNTDDRPVRQHAHKLGRNPDATLAFAAKQSSESWIVDADDPAVPLVWAAARRCHLALGCRHYSLFDFRIDPDGRPWFLEAGLYCSFSPSSVISTMMREAGTPLDDFFATAVSDVLEVVR